MLLLHIYCAQDQKESQFMSKTNDHSSNKGTILTLGLETRFVPWFFRPVTGTTADSACLRPPGLSHFWLNDLHLQVKASERCDSVFRTSNQHVGTVPDALTWV